MRLSKNIKLKGGILLNYKGSQWDPSQAPETFFWIDPSRIIGNENDTVISLPNLADSRGLLASVTATNCTLRNIRGVSAIRLDSSAPSKLAGLLSVAQAQPVVVYAVATSDIAFASNILIGGGPGGAGTESRITYTTTNFPRTITGGAGTALSIGATGPSVNQPGVVAYKYSGATQSKIYYEGSVKNTGNGGTAAFSGITIGDARAGGAPFAGLVGGVCAQLNPSDALINQTIGYLQNQYKTSAKRWQVLREGDSLTAGTGGIAGHGGYAYDLESWSRTQPGGVYLDFIGTQRGDLSTYSNCHHYGIGGTDVVYHINAGTGIQNIIGPGNSYHPDILDLRIGTNDANGTNRTYDGAARIADYATLLAIIRTSEPQCRIIVHKIPPIGGAGTQTANAIDWNSRLVTAWSNEISLGGKLHVCDDFTAMGGVWNGSLMTDNLHPNPAGYAILLSAVKPVFLSAIAALG